MYFFKPLPKAIKVMHYREYSFWRHLNQKDEKASIGNYLGHRSDAPVWINFSILKVVIWIFILLHSFCCSFSKASGTRKVIHLCVSYQSLKILGVIQLIVYQYHVSLVKSGCHRNRTYLTWALIHQMCLDIISCITHIQWFWWRTIILVSNWNFNF